jgi:NAD(P)-dependent dehydrogenase (short-subunit alcohol dehydrogenase family)
VDRLKGKMAIVSGAARGMGAAEATLFAEEGANVLIGDVRVDEAQVLAEGINQAVGRKAAIGMYLDVARQESWAAATDFIDREWGGTDVLVNNAGVVSPSGLMEGSEEDWDRLVSINQKGVWLGMRAVVPAMRRAGGGSIVNISSVGGLTGTAIQTIYHGTKGAVRLLTKAAAANLAPDNIRVNSIHPGTIQTDMLGSISPEELQMYANFAPLRRVGMPKEVAWAAVFLASDEASFVTGAELAVDGGFTAV